MLPSTINNLFGAQTTAAPGKAANGAPGTGNASFDAMLKRELDGRENAKHAESTSAAPTRSARGASQETSSARARQESDHSQRSQQAGSKANQSADSPATKNVGLSKAPEGSQNATARKTSTDDTEKNNDASDQVDDVSAAAENTAAGSPSNAAASLLALVNTMAPKMDGAAGSGAPSIDAGDTGGAAAVLAKNARGMPGATDDSGADSGAPSDPAFDAFVAQATKATQARGARPAEPLATRGDGSAVPTVQASNAVNGSTGVGGASPASAEPALSLIQAASTTQLPAPAVLAGALPAMAATLGTGAAQSAGATDTLTPHVGTPAWDQALGQKVVWMAAGAEQTASLTLNPPDLGPVQIVINVSNSQADAAFMAAQPETRQALEAAMPKLKEMLADAGISLGQTSVSAGSPNQQGFAGQQQARTDARHASVRAGARGEADAPAVARASGRPATGGNGLVDTFA